MCAQAVFFQGVLSIIKRHVFSVFHGCFSFYVKLIPFYNKNNREERGKNLEEHFIVERYPEMPSIVTVRINKPDKLGALAIEDLAELEEMVDGLEEDKSCRVLVFTGTGRGFISGADISKLKTASKEHSMAYSKLAKRLYGKFERGRIITIAAINGYALGGGLEFAIACDIRIAAKSAKLGITETSIGSIPGSGGTLRLPRLIGLGHAKEMLATAEKMPAERAGQIGLVNHVTEDEDLLEKTYELAKTIAGNSTTAIAVGKQLMTDALEMDILRAAELETLKVGANYGGHDQREGMAAFMEKRKPEFE